MKIAKIAVPAPIVPFDNLYDYRIPDEFEEFVAPGSLVEIPLGRRKTFGVVFAVESHSALDAKKLKSLIRPIVNLPIIDPARLELLRWLCRYYFYPLGEVCESAIPAVIRDASEKVIAKALGVAESLGSPQNNWGSRKTLNETQQVAVDKIIAGEKTQHLLFGVTGSGKTEVYLRVIEDTLSKGLGALILVPEIALTPQLQERFEQRFPGEVALFHSAQKPKALREAWMATLLGKKRIALGARSAVFAPVQNLGVIVVDEEHDSSYKQEDRLKYNARDAAIELAKLSHSKLILGSATPSCEALYSVQTGELELSRLPQRAVSQAPLPEIEIVDLKKSIAVENKDPLHIPPESVTPTLEIKVDGEFFLSPALQRELTATLEKKQQAILFLNRRGMGSQELCRSCGHTLSCPNCDVNLTPHSHALVCHYCAYQIASPRECPNCLKKNFPFIKVGIGTEAVEKAVQAHFPAARILRLDRDNVQTHDDLVKIIEEFKSEKSDILIGTQMVAKGHDFPQVTFVGILLAELGLAVPDFRAYEKNLQLLLQVSGRAGRGLHPGKIVLQTFQPDHPVFEQLKNQKSLEDYEAFMAVEMQKRKFLGYPPSNCLALLRFDGLENSLVEEAAELVARSLNKIDSKTIKVLGPVSSPIYKIRNRFRWQILVKATQSTSLAKGIDWIFEGWQKNKFEKKFKTRLVIDRDPVQML